MPLIAGSKLKPNKAEPKHYVLFSLCLASPLIFSVIRKYLPGQPNYIEVSSILTVFIIGNYVFTRGQKLPKWISSILLLWMLLQLLYLIPAFIVDYRIGFAAIATRIFPMFMALIAYNSIREVNDIKRALAWISYLSVPFFLASFYVAIRGMYGLPKLLLPIERIIQTNRYINKGLVYTGTAIFSTPTQLGYFGLISLFIILLLHSLDIKIVPFCKNFFSIILGTLSVLITLLSARRLVFYFSMSLLISYLILRRKIKLIAILVIVLSFTYLLNQLAPVHSPIITKWSDIIFNPDYEGITYFQTLELRIKEPFLNNIIHALNDNYFGHFLGSRGQEAIAFGYYLYGIDNDIEVGAAQLAHEMGILGLFCFPLMILLFVYKIYRKSIYSIYRLPLLLLILFFIAIFLAYYLKSLQILSTNSMISYMFWAIPGICSRLLEIGKYRNDRQKYRFV